MPSMHNASKCDSICQKINLWRFSSGTASFLCLVAIAKELRQGLIAINYPSRKFGLTRHVNITEAKKLCPNLIMQHVATWKEGDEKWAYHEDAAKNIATHKVSLDPYRLESRRILSCIKETLPADVQKVEKASIDEVFMDLSAQVHSILLERYPELSGPAPYDDPTECLPLPPTTALDWQADALVDLDVDETEEDDPDWDDVAILIGSEIVRDVRKAVREKLKYTCSGGIAQNKMLAKLGSAHKKPNQQTVIRNRAIQMFMSDFKFTKIRGLGGKLGDQITSAFNTDTVKDLLPMPIEQLKQKLGDDTSTWVYQIIRGNDSSEVNSRTQIKSMLSAKSFRPSINTPEQAHRWLRIFAALPSTLLTLSRSSSTLAASASDRSARRSAVALVVAIACTPCANWSIVNSRLVEIVLRRDCIASGSSEGACSCSRIARWGLSKRSGLIGESCPSAGAVSSVGEGTGAAEEVMSWSHSARSFFNLVKLVSRSTDDSVLLLPLQLSL